MPMRYGTVFVRGGDIFDALQTVQDVVDAGGPCCVQNYSYYRLDSPKRLDDNQYRINIPSNGGYYVAVDVLQVEDGVFQIDVLGADLGSRGDQDRLGRCILEQLKKRGNRQGQVRISF